MMHWQTFTNLTQLLGEYEEAVERTNGTEGWEADEAKKAVEFLVRCEDNGITLTDGQRRFVQTHSTKHEADYPREKNHDC